MKPQPVCSRATHYLAHHESLPRDRDAGIPEKRTLGEDVSLGGIVAQLHALGLTDVTEVTINAQVEGWQIPLAVPKQVYAYSAGQKWFLQAVEAVPRYWDFPSPYIYFALDWKTGLYVENSTLQNLVRSLREAGHSFVSSFDLKIGARFAREDNEADDTVQVPLSLVCYDYDPDDDDVIEIDEGWDETDGVGEFTTPCSPLPLQAELLPSDAVFPHFLFGDILVQQRRLKQLLQYDKPMG